jgi:hypothetical protein
LARILGRIVMAAIQKRPGVHTPTDQHAKTRFGEGLLCNCIYSIIIRFGVQKRNKF